MASSKLIKSSNSDLSKRPSPSIKPSTPHHQTLASPMTVDGILRDVFNSTAASTTTDATLLDAQIMLIDSNDHNIVNHHTQEQGSIVSGKSVDDVWRDIVSGEKRELKEEATDELMTLEDFLAKAGAVDEVDVGEDAGADVDVKLPITQRLSGGVYAFDPAIPLSPFQMENAIVGFGNAVEVISSGGGGGVIRGGGRAKRGRVVLEPLDKAAQQRQRRMIKNRESAARSRERKQVGNCVYVGREFSF